MSSNIKVQRICQLCGKEFIARTTVTQFCGDVCARRAYKAKKRNELVEQSNREMLLMRGKPKIDLLKTDDKKNPLSIIELKSKEYLTISETSLLLSISRWTIWRAIKRDELPSAKIGRRTLIRRTDLDRLFGDPSAIVAEQIPKGNQLHPLSRAAAESFDITNSYTMTEVQQKFGISEKALYDVIKRNNIPKIKRGWYAYVPKETIDKLLS